MTLLALLKRVSNWIAISGLILLLAALASYVSSQQVDVRTQILLAVGAVFLLAYLVLESGRVRSSLRGRALRYGSNSLLLSAAFVGIMVMANLLGAGHYWRWDVTASQQYSLSEQTINILRALKEPVKVMAFFSASNPYQVRAQRQLDNLLKSYAVYSDHFSYEFVDPDLKPSIARQYEVVNFGTVVFVRGNKTQQTTGLDEQSLTSALLKVTRDQAKHVYFLTGHKERDLEDDGEWGYHAIGYYLEKNNYRVQPLNLTITDTLPSDMDVLVIASPQVPLAEKEINLIDTYLTGGGKAMVLSDPAIDDPFGGLLTRWGLAFEDDVVVDPASSFPQDVSAIVAMKYEFPDITRGVQGLLTFFPGARSLTTLDNVTDTITISPIVKTSDMSWGERNYRDENPFRYDEGVDIRGPLPIAMAVTASASDMRLVVFGNSEFVSNRALQNVQGAGNQDLFTNSINWLAEEAELIAISPKPAEQRFLVIPPGSARLVVFSSLVVLPLLVIVTGVVVWWKRR